VARGASAYTFLTVAVPTSATGSDLFLALDLPAPAQVDANPSDICDGCAFDQGSCLPVTAAVSRPVSSSFHVRLGGEAFKTAPGVDLARAQAPPVSGSV